jgi:hypothetical protein
VAGHDIAIEARVSSANHSTKLVTYRLPTTINV